jgi:hypothetical protein
MPVSDIGLTHIYKRGVPRLLLAKGITGLKQARGSSAFNIEEYSLGEGFEQYVRWLHL